jgi:hypothetical protein
MAFSNSTNREIYDFRRPDEKPVEVPRPVRDTNFSSNFPRREMKETEDAGME